MATARCCAVASALPSAGLTRAALSGRCSQCRPVAIARRSLSVRCAAATETSSSSSDKRQIWLPGSTAPAYLDGSLPGDNGFDPLGLAEHPEALRWYVQAELVHSRWAMLGVAGVLGTDLLTTLGIKDLPVWYDAGTAHYDIADAPTLFAVQFILFNFVELKRWADFEAPGSQGDDEEAWFLGIQPAFLGTDNGYPGGLLFNPFGLAADAVTGHKAREQELANGRLAMVAAVGFAVQAAFTHAGPTANLLQHLSDPWNTTIIQTILG
ncbi:hypothetical protein CLOM_g15013 [Closterium sp. NIES-68]|nr:hypothetical protein CLOM_g15013 [Closterium sp. NIES-68]GJP79732.1 hypothetical protein CLOP_g9928 [Closterium sp. NIES-67]